MARPPAAAGRTGGDSRNAAARWRDRATGPAELRPAAGAIADHLPIRTHDRAGPPFRQAHDGLQMRYRSALGGGPYHFFERSSRSAAASSICSARSFFSFPFSSSRPSTASFRKRPCRRIWPSNCRSSPRRSRACEPDRPSSPPASCSFSTAIICSSVNRARFICPSFFRADSSSFWRKYSVAGHYDFRARCA
ncbi:hypothetical protein ACVWZ4_001236 [Bradyrhizobium sp. USDA 4472]